MSNVVYPSTGSFEALRNKTIDEVTKDTEVKLVANTISDSAVAHFKGIVSANNTTGRTYSSWGPADVPRMVENWTLSDSDINLIKGDVATALGCNITVLGGQIKKWHKPSGLHADASHATYSLIIPLDFEIKTGWSYVGPHYKNDVSITLNKPAGADESGGGANSAHTYTLPMNTEHPGPNLVITEAVYDAAEKGWTLFKFDPREGTNAAAKKTEQGFDINSDFSGVTGLANSEMITARETALAANFANTALGGKMILSNCKHVPYQMQKQLIEHKNSPLPWTIGAGLFFKPYLIHCSSSWGGVTSIYANGRRLRNRGQDTWGNPEFEPGVSKTHLLLNVQVNT